MLLREQKLAKSFMVTSACILLWIEGTEMVVVPRMNRNFGQVMRHSTAGRHQDATLVDKLCFRSIPIFACIAWVWACRKFRGFPPRGHPIKTLLPISKEQGLVCSFWGRTISCAFAVEDTLALAAYDWN